MKLEPLYILIINDTNITNGGEKSGSDEVGRALTRIY